MVPQVWRLTDRSITSLLRVMAIVSAWGLVNGSGQGWGEHLTNADHFETHVRPLLVNRCLPCHSAVSGKTGGGLALDNRAGWLQGGDRGPAIVPGQSARSLLLTAVEYHDSDLQMPPLDAGGKLPVAEINVLREWIDRGAYDPRVEELRVGGATVEQVRTWWSFQPLQAVPVPEVPLPERPLPKGSWEAVAAEDSALQHVSNGRWGSSPIDRFIAEGHARGGLQPNRPADKRTLLRRVTFDLTGLPPTLEEIEAFEADRRPDAFHRVVDRLLASPLYGERWGRHWLDVARYADTAGDGADYPVREAYRYRDWVINAFNADMPYDEFVRQQVAGDLLASQSSPDQYAAGVTATGFLAVGKRYGYAPNADFQHLDFADTIDSIGRVFLGLSLGCARCHDHKYDPITMADYYAWYGILQSTQWSFPGGEEHPRPAHLVPLVPPATARRLDEQKQAEALYESAYGVTEGTPTNARIQLRGEPHKLGDEVPRRNLQLLGGDTVSASGSGRADLAHWLTRKDNPLTARVFANRIWQGHFGKGFVATPSDFGLRGALPTHPELLDWLAYQLVRRAWSTKALHREVMLSETYQLASEEHSTQAAVDPNNLLYGRYARRGLDAESMRDAMLAISGRLIWGRGGPHPFPAVDTWAFSIHKPFHANYDSYHRTIYLMSPRNRPHPYLTLFNAADPNVTTAARQPTTTPTQTLYLMNSPFVHEMGRHFAARILRAADTDVERIGFAIEAATGRLPDLQQQAMAETFLQQYRQQMLRQPIAPESREVEVWSALARVMFTCNAFLYVD